MKGTVIVIFFSCIFTICKTQETSRGFSSSDSEKNVTSTRNIDKDFEPSISYAFQKRNYNTSLEGPPSYVYSKWSSGISTPNSLTPVKDVSEENVNATNVNQNSTQIFNVKNTQNVESTKNFSVSNSTKDSNSTPESQKISEQRKIKSGYKKKNNQLLSKGITHYFWDTVYVLFRCFRDHWKEGVLDCVTSRASTILDDLLGLDDKHNKLDLKNGFGLLSYGTELEETPRNDNDDSLQLPMEDDEEEDDREEEYETYDEGTELSKDSREGAIKRRRNRRKHRRYLRKLKMIIIGVVATMLPIVAAAKLKFIIMMSLGLGFFGFIIGKTLMFSMLSLPAAFLSSFRKESYNFVKKFDSLMKPPFQKFHKYVKFPKFNPFKGGRNYPD